MADNVAMELDQEMTEPTVSAAVDPETVDNNMDIDEKTPTNSPSKSSPDLAPYESPPPPPVLAVKRRSRLFSEDDENLKETSRKLFEETPDVVVAPPSTATAIPATGAEETKGTVELRG